MMTNFAQTFISQLANKFHIGFIGGADRILKCPLITVALVRLRMTSRPRGNFIFIDADLAIFDPAVELGQRFGIVVFANTGIHPVVPAMHSANDVVTINMSVGHQGAPVGTASV